MLPISRFDCARGSRQFLRPIIYCCLDRNRYIRPPDVFGSLHSVSRNSIVGLDIDGFRTSNQ